IMPGPPPLVTIATLRPVGTGWLERRVATLKSSSRVLTLMMPACWKRASDAICGVARAPVCDEAARDPAVLLPPLTATMGLTADALLAMRAKFRGLPKDSRWGGRSLDVVSC